MARLPTTFAKILGKPLNIKLIISGTKLASSFLTLRTYAALNRRSQRPDMKILSALFTFLIVGVVILMAIPVLSAGIGLLVIAACFFVWFLPILLILGSDVTTGGEKAAWILAIIFLSWFAWIFYFLLAPLKQSRPYRY